MKPILISIVTYNSKDIFQTLDQLSQFLPDKRYELIIYDNGSESSYIEQMKSYEFANVWCSNENKGFGHGHNRVFLSSDYDYGIICNPDILVEKETMDRLIDLLKNDDQLAAASPIVLNEDGSIQYLVRHKLTVFDYFLRFIPFTHIKKAFNQRLSDYECRDLPRDEYSYIRMGSGCFMAIDIKKFKDINGFDERFFMYFEDNDLCLRFEEKGYKILYSPFDSVTHLYGKGAHRSRKLFFVFMNSMRKFFRKWGWRFF